MKKYPILAMSALLLPSFSLAQDGVRPISSSANQPTAEVQSTTVVRRDLSPETLSVLRDIRRESVDREAEIQAALNLRSEAEANVLLDTILADVRDENAEVVARQRLGLDVVNRTAQDREDYVGYMTQRLQGNRVDAPLSYQSRIAAAPAPESDVVVQAYQPRFYDDNRRVITYRTRSEIPAVLLASNQLKRVQVTEVAGSPYMNDLVVVDDMPEAYIAPSAYAVSYAVDPDTLITRDDILFVQGSTEFADAYSYDIVVDLATALNNPALANYSFIVEGHASAEGDYTTNLNLSQLRAERIAREMIRFGVSSSRLIPVGYGENEARYPANAAENLRATDRRVVVFRLAQ